MLSSRRTSSGVRAGLSSSILALATLASGGGCTLIVGGQLADKPLEGAGGAGGAASTASQSSSAAESSSGAQSSGATGGLMCPPGTASCDGHLLNGCETKIQSDSKNCGACKKQCQDGEHCKEGQCQ